MEVLYGFIGKLIHDGRLTYAGGVAIAFTGTITGNVIGYGLGLYGGRLIVNTFARALHIDPERLKRFERWFHKNGLKAIFIIRWTGWGYAQITWFSGITRAPFWRFLAYAAVSDLAWALFWTFAGRSVIQQFEQALLNPRGFLFFVGLVLLVIAGAVWWHRNRRKSEVPAQKPDNDPK